MFRVNYIVQIFSLIFMSLVTQIGILVIKPFQNSKTNGHALFNEFFVSLYLYILLILSDFAGVNPLRDECGWALVFILMIVQLVNFLKFLFNLVLAIKNSNLCKWCLKRSWADPKTTKTSGNTYEEASAQIAGSGNEEKSNG